MTVMGYNKGVTGQAEGGRRGWMSGGVSVRGRATTGVSSLCERPQIKVACDALQALQSGPECRGRIFVGADGAPITFEVQLN